MASLANKMFDAYFGDLLQVSNSGLGADSTLRDVESALGTATALQLSTNVVNVNGTFKIGGNTITIPNTFTISGNYTFTATLTANTSVTFPVSGTLTTNTGTVNLTNKTLDNTNTLSDTAIVKNTFSIDWPNVSANDTLIGAATTATLTNKTLTSPTLTTPVLGTPASGNLSNCTAYPVASVANLGTGVATFLTTPSSANLAAAVTDETGSGLLVFATSPTLTTPTLGVASATSINFGGGALSTYIPWTTFTPTVTSSVGGDTVPVYSTNQGRYTRIGNVVHVQIYLAGDGGAEGSGSGDLRIALPIAAGASVIAGQAQPAGYRRNSTSTFPVFVSYVASTAYVTLFYLDPAANAFVQITPTLQNNTTRAIYLAFSYEV